MIVNKIQKILLPFFPENKKLQKYKWHKIIKLIAIVISISSLYTVLWIIFLAYFMPRSWMNLPLYALVFHLSSIIDYLPVRFTSLFSQFPIYQTVFHSLFFIPIIGPFALIFILISFFYISPSLLYRLSLYISERFYLRKVKIILMIVAVVLGSFIFSTWEYQHLVNEDSVIADQQCLKVNPQIIARKNSYINSMKIIQASGSAEEYWAENKKYLDFSKKYIEAQKAWLVTQNTFMKRQDFTIFIPAYIRKAAQLQYDSREAGMKATSGIVQFFETYKNLDANQQKVLSNTILDETKKSNDADDEYNKLYNSYKGKFDLRNYFTTAPQTTCPPENFNIPNVPDMLNPQTIPSNSPLG